MTISPQHPKPFNFNSLKPKTKPIFEKVENNLGIDFTHAEDSYIDFNRQKLIPYQISDRGPAFAFGDLNDDGKDDLFFGGSKHNSSKVFVQKDSVYVAFKFPLIAKDSIKEDVIALIADFDNNQKNDLLIGTGGADFFNEMKPLLDSYYLQKK